MSGEAAEHEFQIPGVEGHPQLGFRGQGDGVAGIFLGPAFEKGAVRGIPRQLRMPGEDMGAELFVAFPVKGVLTPDDLGERPCQPRIFYLLRDHEVVLEQDVALRFFRIGTEAKLLDVLHQKPGYPQDVEVEYRVFGDGTVAHLEDDIPV